MRWHKPHKKKAIPKHKRVKRRKIAISSHQTETQRNLKAHWSAYRSLQKKADLAWEKLYTDIQKHAPWNVLSKDRNNLLLILGECDYMSKECLRCAPAALQSRQNTAIYPRH
ncbi:MAG: hypothetical protein HY861_00900 [Chlamydiia bacterium]|nr:hypothetical protein [Chlamydiia bacterium]